MTVEIEALPPRTRLFHVGPPKTGTTALQQVASESRAALLAHGVRYPGRSRNHRLAVAAFLDRPMGWAKADGGRGPSLRNWYELLGELDAETRRRIWFGHEYAARAEPVVIERLAEQLGPSLHVVITLRHYARMLPSAWQELLKAGGSRGEFEPWVRSILKPRGEDDRVRRARHDQPALVARWAGVLGPERVSVVVLNRRDHGFVFRAFESLLGLPAGLLDDRAGHGGNRSMTVLELELLRRLNQFTHERRLSWSRNQRLVVEGAVARILASSSNGNPLVLPEWAVPPANEEAARAATEIAASGVRVIGDIAELAEPVPVVPVSDHRDVDAVPVELAVEALAGLLAVACGRDPDFGLSVDRVGRQVLTHLVDDLRALRETGPMPIARVAAGRAAGLAAGLGYAARGMLAARKKRSVGS